MANKPNISVMTSQDISQVFDLSCSCFSTPWSFKSWQQECINPAAITLIASMDEQVVGFLNVHHVLDEGDFNLIAVKDTYRRKGIATLLMDALFEYAKQHEISSYTLEVRVSNEDAISFYRRLGFELVGRRKEYYSKPIEDGLLLRKQID